MASVDDKPNQDAPPDPPTAKEPVTGPVPEVEESRSAESGAAPTGPAEAEQAEPEKPAPVESGAAPVGQDETPTQPPTEEPASSGLGGWGPRSPLRSPRRSHLATLRGPAFTPAPIVLSRTPAPLTREPVASEEIEGVPVGVAQNDEEEASRAYYEVDISTPSMGPASHLRTIPRSLTLDSLLMFADQLPPLPGLGPSTREPTDIRVRAATGPPGQEVTDAGSTNIWDFVESGAEADLAQDEHVISARYRIADDIGAGGMARIYKVEHLHLGKEFALKIIHPEMSTKPRMRRAFFREAQVTSQLEHPNIVKVTDFGVDERRGAYLVMEYLRGETLHARIRSEGRLRLAFALDVALQVAEALHYMHEQGIIHCDIKSENIFLCRQTGEGRKRTEVKLIDFGLSRTEALGAKLAQSEVAGTPEYMAPEQIRGRAPQPSIDIYALGILMYEMIVGELPFRGEIKEVMRAQLELEVTPPSQILAEELDERAEALIMKALHKDPDERQRSMGQMIFEIRTLMDMLGIRHVRRRGAVVRRPAGVELDGPRLAFEHCPCPLFRLDRDAGILAANPAFCDFVREPFERLQGKPLSATRLGPLYPELRADMAQCAEQGAQLQHLLTFKAKSDGRAAAALCWLVPEFDANDEVVSFTGIIVPFQTLQENGGGKNGES